MEDSVFVVLTKHSTGSATLLGLLLLFTWIRFFCTHPLALPYLIPSCLLCNHGNSSPLLEIGRMTSIIRSTPLSQQLKSGKAGSSHLDSLPFYVHVPLLYQILPPQEDQKGKGLSLFPSFPSLTPSPGSRVSGL